MQAGRLDRRVELQHRVVGTANSHGERTFTYAPYATVRAEKRELAARERYDAQKVQAEIDAVFVIRFRSDVVATDRLICEGRTYDITPGREIGRRQWLELHARAVVA